MTHVESCAKAIIPLVDFEFFEGGSLDIDNPGAFLVINYWAKWCAPCREEIPELNALQDEYRNQIIIAGVNFDQPIDTVLHEEKKVLGVLFPTFKIDPRVYLKLPPVTVLPETLILNSDGELLHRLIGPQTKESIRYNAPLQYTAQDRAVTSKDYETIVKSVYANAQSVSA